MRHSLVLSAALAGLLLGSAGCSGPSYKLGRGLNNMTELLRGGEMRRSIEQSMLWNGADASFSFGSIQGFNRSIGRTVLGAVEVATFVFPTPTYDPVYKTNPTPQEDTYVGGPLRTDQFFSLKYLTAEPPYPTNFKPGWLSDSIFSTDTALGFSAGDVAPFIPGSRFHIFDY